MGDTKLPVARKITAEKAKEVRANLPQVQCRIDDLLAEYGEPRKFPPCDGSGS